MIRAKDVLLLIGEGSLTLDADRKNAADEKKTGPSPVDHSNPPVSGRKKNGYQQGQEENEKEDHEDKQPPTGMQVSQ